MAIRERAAGHRAASSEKDPMAKKTRSFVVIGLGTFGTSVASELVRFGDHVLGIDLDEQKVARLADELAEAVIVDGRDEEALREAGVGDYDVAVNAIGEDLEASILCTMNLKLIGVSTIWVKAMSRTHHRILTRLGADRVIEVEQETGLRIAQMLHNPLVRDYLSLGNRYFIVDFIVPEELDGRAIGDLDLGTFEVHCLGVMRGSDLIRCDTDETTLRTGDKLLLLGHRQNLRQFGDSL